MRSSFSSRDYEKAVKLLNKYDRENIYKSRDNVLLNLERGTVFHFAGKYDSSNVFFSNAETEISQLFTKSITRGLSSILINDNILAYDGEDYEDIYLNIFKCLNYIHANKLEDALVESRRISYKLNQLTTKYNGLATSLSKADTTGEGNWKPGKNNVQNSALGYYLSAILYAKNNQPDDARIAFENLLKAFKDQPKIFPFETSTTSQLQKIVTPKQYNLLITGFSGRGPRKKQEDIRFFLDDKGTYIKFSFPSLHLYPTQVSDVQVTIDDSLYQRLPIIEKMDIVAKQVYQVKEPLIYAKSLVRSFLKAAGSRAITEGAKEKSRFLGGLAQVVGIFGQELSEKADLRSWQTMPGQAYATVLKLSEGQHNITINYYSRNNNLIYSDQKEVIISPKRNLELIESIYWN